MASKDTKTKIDGLQREFQSMGNMINPVSQKESVMSRFRGMFGEVGYIWHSLLRGSDFEDIF